MRPVAFSSRQPAAPTVLRRYAAICAAAALPLVWAASPVEAMGLGDISAQSALGRPLRVVVPLIVSGDDALSGECFKLSPTGRASDGIPELQAGRVALERIGSRAQIVLSTPRAVNDPLLRLTLQAGCDDPVRREYVLMLDPAAIEAPVIAVEDTATRADIVAPSVPSANIRADVNVRERATGDFGMSATRVPLPGEGRRGTGVDGAPTTRADRAKPARANATSATRRMPSTKASSQPRFSVSANAPAIAGGKDAAETRGLSPQEFASALEAETLLLRHRIAQLSDVVDRLQLEMRAAQATQAARLAAEEAIKPSPQAIVGRGWAASWPLFAAFFGLAALIAAGLGWKRRRVTPTLAVWPAVVALPDPPDSASTKPTIAAPAPIPHTDSPTPSRPSLAAKAANASVAVSELAHVTEEAAVYLAFNRVDRAIDVLREHIGTQPRSLPAAWLMLLDLYRSNSREQEFGRLAQEFHQQFNSQPPKWDTSQHDKDDGGLEAIPRVLEQIVSLWGTPQCREYLELLLHDNRDGQRVGFPPSTYEDILLLRQLCDPAPAAIEAVPAQAPKLRPLAVAPAAPTKPAPRILADPMSPLKPVPG